MNPKPLLNGCPNPVAEDLDYALLHVEGIEAGMSGTVSRAVEDYLKAKV